jgi:hypothetical protein
MVSGGNISLNSSKLKLSSLSTRPLMLLRVDGRREQVVAHEHAVGGRDVEVVLVRRHAAGERALRVPLHGLRLPGLDRLVGQGSGGGFLAAHVLQRDHRGDTGGGS